MSVSRPFREPNTKVLGPTDFRMVTDQKLTQMEVRATPNNNNNNIGDNSN